MLLAYETPFYDFSLIKICNSVIRKIKKKPKHRVQKYWLEIWKRFNFWESESTLMKEAGSESELGSMTSQEELEAKTIKIWLLPSLFFFTLDLTKTFFYLYLIKKLKHVLDKILHVFWFLFMTQYLNHKSESIKLDTELSSVRSQQGDALF